MENKLYNLLCKKLSIDLDSKGLDSIIEYKLVEDLGADSLDIALIILEIEEEFNIEISDIEMLEIKTVKDIKEKIK